MIFSIEWKLVAHKNKCIKFQVFFFNCSCQPHELLAYDTTFFLDFLKLNAYLHVLLHYSHMSSRDVWGIFYELVSRVLMTRLDWQWMLSTCVWIDMPKKIWKKMFHIPMAWMLFFSEMRHLQFFGVFCYWGAHSWNL